tara:strand:+ start:37 stop:291 length:255 start_codon:yes stop_codon:yes gene_type:complete
MSFESEESINSLRAVYKDIKRTGGNLLSNLTVFAGQVSTLRADIVVLRNAAVDADEIASLNSKISEIDSQITNFRASVTATLGL